MGVAVALASAAGLCLALVLFYLFAQSVPELSAIAAAVAAAIAYLGGR